jgi:hypothetical protein
MSPSGGQYFAVVIKVQTKYVTSFASSFIKGGAAERNTTKEVLNCLRVLQRVLPVIFELESESSVFEREVLWKRDVVEGQVHREQTEALRLQGWAKV